MQLFQMKPTRINLLRHKDKLIKFHYFLAFIIGTVSSSAEVSIVSVLYKRHMISPHRPSFWKVPPYRPQPYSPVSTAAASYTPMFKCSECEIARSTILFVLFFIFGALTRTVNRFRTFFQNILVSAPFRTILNVKISQKLESLET